MQLHDETGNSSATQTVSPMARAITRTRENAVGAGGVVVLVISLLMRVLGG